MFTCVTVLFMPPQFLAGLFGMNVTVPFQDFNEKIQEMIEEQPEFKGLYELLPFIGVILLGLLVSLFLFCCFKKFKLINT